MRRLKFALVTWIALLEICARAGAAPAEFSGIWRVEQPVFAARTVDGALPPMTAAARKLYEQRAALRQRGDRTYDSTIWCASPGIPRLMLINHPFEIVVSPKQVLFFYEWDRWARLVDLSGTKLDVIYSSAMGVPTGHWQGVTLVVDTIGLRGNTLLDSAGLPHSENAKITERLTLTSRDVLANRIRVEDAEFYTRPWEMRVTYRRQSQKEIRENVCLDRTRMGKPAVEGE